MTITQKLDPFLPFDLDNKAEVDLHEYTVNILIVQGPLTRDLGHWRKGERVCLTFDLEVGTVTEYEQESAEIRYQYLLAPLDVAPRRTSAGSWGP